MDYFDKELLDRLVMYLNLCDARVVCCHCTSWLSGTHGKYRRRSEKPALGTFIETICTSRDRAFLAIHDAT